MEWLFIVAVSVGIPIVVPPLLTAFDSTPIDAAPDIRVAAGQPADAFDDDHHDVPDSADAEPTDSNASNSVPIALFVGVVLVVAGIAGLISVWVDASLAVALGASLALGLACAAMVPDLMAALTRREPRAAEPIPD